MMTMPTGNGARGSVAIVGAGAVGLACARALQRSGHAVTVFDPAELGSGASSGNAGLIAGSAVIPEANMRTLCEIPQLLFRANGPLTLRLSHLPRMAPFLWHFVKSCRPSEFDRLSRAMAGLSLAGFDHWMALLDDLEEARSLFRRDGCLYLYLSDKERRKAENDNQTRRARGMPLVELTPAEVKERVPDLGVETAGAVLAKSSGHVVAPDALCRSLLQRIIADGGTFHPVAVTDLVTAEKRVTAVRTSSGDDFPADRLVLAAGAYSRPLAARLGLFPPLDSQRGYHIMVRKSANAIALPMLVPSLGMAVTPMREGVRFAGLVEFASMDSAPSPALHRLLKHSARRLFPQMQTETAVEWAGQRPSLPDCLPIIDRAPGFSNAYFTFGHGQMGLTQAAVTGHAIRALIDNATPPVDLTPYRATRFSKRGA